MISTREEQPSRKKRISTNYNVKATHQIIHSRLQFMLECTEEPISAKMGVEMGPPN